MYVFCEGCVLAAASYGLTRCHITLSRSLTTKIASFSADSQVGLAGWMGRIEQETVLGGKGEPLIRDVC